MCPYCLRAGRYRVGLVKKTDGGGGGAWRVGTTTKTTIIYYIALHRRGGGGGDGGGERQRNDTVCRTYRRGVGRVTGAEARDDGVRRRATGMEKFMAKYRYHYGAARRTSLRELT